MNSEKTMKEEKSKEGSFLEQIKDFDGVPELKGKEKSIKLLTSGLVETVYMLTVDDRRYALLVGHEGTEQGIVKKEYKNLKRLHERNRDSVVKPLYYLSNETMEAMLEDFIDQAWTIVADYDVLHGETVEDARFGIFLPGNIFVNTYKPFSKSQTSIVKSCIIAMLIKLFDEKSNLGLASCQIANGDFVFAGQIDDKEFNYENVLNRLTLSAARELVSMTLEEYIDIIRKEFTIGTQIKNELNSNDKTQFIINKRSLIPMTNDEIEKGIELGIQLRDKDKEIEGR